jgi:Carbohydrate family 9 binding domain-like
MNGFASILLTTLFVSGIAVAGDQAVIESIQVDQDAPLTLDPALPFWRGSRPIHLEKDIFGKIVPRFRTEVRTRWTKNNLYFLFVCPYEELYLRPNPSTQQETNELWNWDVAEVFVGSDFDDIQRYKEFEVSPQGEWVDLDIDLHKPHHENGWKWNSEFETKARVDQSAHIWYAAMRIPFAAIDKRPATAGNTLRINLFLSQGPPANHQEICWQAPMNRTFHVPERFGVIRLVNK